MKRGVAVVLLLAVLLAILVVVNFLVIPRFIEQSQQLIQQIPGEWNRLYGRAQDRLKAYPTLQHALPSRSGDMLNTLMAQIGGIANFMLRSTLSLANGILVGTLCFLVVIYTLVDPVPVTGAYHGKADELTRFNYHFLYVRHEFAVWLSRRNTGRPHLGYSKNID